MAICHTSSSTYALNISPHNQRLTFADKENSDLHVRPAPHAVTYIPPIAALKKFSGPSAPAKSSLLAHIYGVKNVYTGLIRLYAAYYINTAPVYDLATVTFVGVLFLYISECFVFETVRVREAVFPFVTAGVGLFWMVSGRKTYLGL
ncbi:hypothetical protein BJX63DRAFT_98750 [Aspergillus granulosus]|uniref:Uncharacterized protein n=1 Tax=Aspergillus granulosus TaxID=176169 RepID=A0ABR4GUL3_9EURO